MKESRLGKASDSSSALEKLTMEKLGAKEAVPLPALIADLSNDLGYTKDGVTEGVMGLQSKKVIIITEKTRHASFTSYARSPISLWFWAAFGATLLSVALVFVTSGLALYLRYAFGGLLILFIPGFSLIELLYPKKELDELTVLALSIGLSLALVPLVGLILNYTPLGIKLVPVTFSIVGLTMALLVSALVRRHRVYDRETAVLKDEGAR